VPDDDGLFLGHGRAVDAVRARNTRHLLPAHHLVTHSVILGMTGSGKTGLVTVVIEEALRNGIPVLAIDVKGALPNLMLAFPTCDAQSFAPFALGTAKLGDERTVDELAEALATERREALEAWGIGEPELQSYADTTSFRLITPGSDAGELLHILSSLEVRSDRWDTDPQSARASLSVAVSLVLRLLGRDPDPAKSRERVLLSILAERRLLAGDHADLATLMDDLAEPPLEEIGALPLDEYLPPGERKTLAQALHSLLASPTFSSWRQGAPLDVAGWMTPRNGRTPAVIVSVAHLDDAERTQVLGVLLEEVLQWVRGLPAATESARRLRRGVRLLAAAPSEPTDEATDRRADEASARLRRWRSDRDAESDGLGLPRARERGSLVHRQIGHRRRSRARRRRHGI